MALQFDANGLIPAIVQDHYSGQVLMLAYMNAESLAISIAEKRTCFWSRSRGKLWRKGEESGNVQHIVSIKADCDEDALLVQVIKEGRHVTRERKVASSTRFIWTTRYSSSHIRGFTTCFWGAKTSRRKAATHPICSIRVWIRY